jgi:hypothetical protein
VREQGGPDPCGSQSNVENECVRLRVDAREDGVAACRSGGGQSRGGRKCGGGRHLFRRDEGPVPLRAHFLAGLATFFLKKG